MPSSTPEPTEDEKNFYDEIAEAIMEAENYTTLDGLGKINIRRLKQALKAAARMGAEGAVSLMPEHVVAPAMWVCAICHNPITLKEVDDERSEWVHA